MSSNDALTNTLLGYPADARLLIINADDFGMCHASNEATMRSLRGGIATSTTVMTPCPWAPHALRWLAANPDIPFGVHLTIVRDFDDYRWGPVAPKDLVPSLVSDGGAFYPYARIPELLSRADPADLEVEFRAQIETVLAAGLAPTHLDWHCLADGGRADIFDLTMRLAKEYGLALRVHDRALAERCHRQGLPANDHGILDSYRYPAGDKAARFAQLLRELPAGLSEWAVHPSLGTAEAVALEPENWQIRRADFDFVTSPEAADIVREEGIVLLDYRALQAVWSHDESHPAQGAVS